MAKDTFLTDRRPTFLIDTPCLTRQYTIRAHREADPVSANNQVMRRGGGDRQTGAQEARARLGVILDHLNEYIDQVTAGRPGPRFVPRNATGDPANATERRDRYRSIFLAVHRHGVPIEVIIDVHTEYITVNLRAYPAVGQSELDYGERLSDTLEKLSTAGGQTLAWTDNDVANDAFMEMIYDGFWADHMAGLDDPCRFLDSVAQDRPYECVAMFKGIVLRRAEDTVQFAEHCEQMLVDIEPEKSITKPIIAKRFLARTDGSGGTSAVSTEMLTSGNFRNLQDLLNRHPGFFTRILGFRSRSHALTDRSRDYQGGNAILCGFLDGLAVFGSSFGREASDGVTMPEVRYFLLYDGPSRNQLARLVRRVHNCGENRIFALIDRAQMLEAAEELRAVLRQLEDLNSRRATTLAQVRRITLQVETQTRRVRGGLRFRIARSEYYWSTLQDRIRTLRGRRIIGWQTYEEFIGRIFRPQVETYMRLRDELQRIEANIIEAEQLVTAKSTHQLQLMLVPFVFFSYFEMLSYMDNADFWTWGRSLLASRAPGLAAMDVHPVLVGLIKVATPLVLLFLVYAVGYWLFLRAQGLWRRWT